MTMTDPIADMLTRIRNAYKARHNRVDVPSSSLKKEIARILLQEKMISNYREIQDDRQNVLRVYLKYGADETPAMIGSKRISRPGLIHPANDMNNTTTTATMPTARMFFATVSLGSLSVQGSRR